MACCVVLNLRSRSVGRADSAENSSGLSSGRCSRSRPQARPNPQRTAAAAAALTSRVTSTTAAAASRGKSARGNGCDTEPAAVFKEPWAKLLSQAKEKSRKVGVKVKPGRNAGASCRENQERTEEITLLEHDTPASVPTDLKEVQDKPNVSQSRRRNKNDGSQGGQVVSEDASSTCTARQSINSTKPRATRSRKRASSLEWNCSGSESADTPQVPQNKRKRAPKKKKRASSIEAWLSGSDSDGGQVESPSKFDAYKQCCICKLKFRRPWLLRSHLYQHIDPNNRPFKCEEDGCSKAYYLKAHLERHISRSHSVTVIVSNVACPAEGCNRILATQCGLKRHINKMHSAESLKFSCPHCDKKFSKNKQLRYHIAEHNNEPPLRCEKCNVGAYSDREMKRHMRTHKEYPCDIPGCEKVLHSFSSFRKHKAEHNRCFQSLCCAHCNKQFSTPRNLRAHVMTHLEDKPIFRCTYDSCPRFYYQKRNLTAHIRVRHEKRSNFACDWPDCDMQFLCRRALTKHTNVHQNGKAPPKRKEGPRAPRKDKGKFKQAMASRLTGLDVPPAVQQELLTAEKDIEVSESEENDTRSDSCDWKSHLKNVRVKSVEASLQTVSCDTSSPPNAGLPKENQSDQITPLKTKETASSSLTGEVVLPEGMDVLAQSSMVLEVSDDIATCLMGKTFEIGDGGVLIEIEEDKFKSSVKSSTSISGEESEQVDSTLFKTVGVTQVNAQTEVLERGSAIMEQNNEQLDQGDGCLILNKPTTPDVQVEEMQDPLGPSPKSDEGTSSQLSLLVNGETCVLSATLCAETIVDFPSSHAEREVLLLIPKMGHMPSMNEVLSVGDRDAVVKALSGDVDVYSVAENDKTGLLGDSQYYQLNEASLQESLKKISVNDPSVASILQPLIQNLASKHGHSDQAQSVPSKFEGNATAVKTSRLSRRKFINPAQLHKLRKGRISNRTEEPHLQDGSKKCEAKSKDPNPVPRQFLNPAFVQTVQNDQNATKCVSSPVSTDSEVAGGISALSHLKPVERADKQSEYQRTITTFAQFLHRQHSGSPLKSMKAKSRRSLRDNLQGPAQEQTDSNSSSVSESDDSRSDSGSGNSDNEYSSEEDVAVDGDASDNSDDGDNGNEDGDNEDEEDEADEQPEEEEEEEEEEDNDEDGENGNNNGGQLNGDDNNNNDDAGNSDSDHSERQVDPESTNGYRNIGDGSELGVDRAASPKENAPKENGEETLDSDALIIDVGEDEACPSSVSRNVAISQNPLKPVSAPGKLRQLRRTRLRQLEVTNLVQQDGTDAPEEPTSKVILGKKKKEVKEAGTETQLEATSLLGDGNEKRSKRKKDVTKREHQEKSKTEMEGDGKLNLSARDAVAKKTTAAKGVEKIDQNGGKKAVPPPVKRRTKQKFKKLQQLRVQKSEKKSSNPRKRFISETDSSGGELSPPKRRRRCNISDDDSEGAASNMLQKSSRVSPSEDPLGQPVRDEHSSSKPNKTEDKAKTGVACRQLSESAWISVLRQASKAMKLSLTAAED